MITEDPRGLNPTNHKRNIIIETRNITHITEDGLNNMSTICHTNQTTTGHKSKNTDLAHAHHLMDDNQKGNTAINWIPHQPNNPE